MLSFCKEGLIRMRNSFGFQLFFLSFHFFQLFSCKLLLFFLLFFFVIHTFLQLIFERGTCGIEFSDALADSPHQLRNLTTPKPVSYTHLTLPTIYSV